MKKMNPAKHLLVLAIIFISYTSAAQTDLFKTAKEESAKEDASRTDITIATFKNTRLINGHSIETLGRGMMDFRVHHRFGFINQGLYELFGLDNATTLLGFDFGITDRFMVGFSRSGYLKQMEGFAKYRLLRQSKGKVNMPLSVTLLTAMVIKTADINTLNGQKATTADKTSYVYQALIASKITDGLSLQLMPTMIHYNLVPGANDANDMFSLGIGARQKISRRISINGEYYYQFNKLTGYHNSLALGVDIETGGHVFQLHFTNSTGMTEPTFIHETSGDWGNGDIHFGFNVSRVFKLKKAKDSRSTY